MGQTVTEILDAALALPEPERAELAELIAASLMPATLHPGWRSELDRRAAEVDSGAVKPVPWDEVRRQAQARLDADEPRREPNSKEVTCER